MGAKQSEAEAHFNSTIVRLKERIVAVAEGVQQYFNSTIVRLKANNELTSKWTAYKFQFYNSTIKRTALDLLTGNREYFNSTIVRLKVR